MTGSVFARFWTSLPPAVQKVPPRPAASSIDRPAGRTISSRAPDRRPERPGVEGRPGPVRGCPAGPPDDRCEVADRGQPMAETIILSGQKTGAAEADRSGQRVAALEVEGLSHSFGKRQALVDVGFTIAPGSFTVLLGQNGAGKTTLFSLITRLYNNRTGSIRIFGIEVRAQALAGAGRARGGLPAADHRPRAHGHAEPALCRRPAGDRARGGEAARRRPSSPASR